MVELGKFILTHYPSFSIKILITPPPYNAGSTGPYINRVSATTSSITFHHLPAVSLPPNNSPHHETLAFELLRLNNPNVHQAIASISDACTVRALIMDFFCCPALSVGADLNIPAYFFFTSGAASLGAFFYIPFLHRSTNKSFKDLNSDLDIPGMPPIPSADMAKPILERNEKVYEDFLNASIQLPKSAGIIVNTFESLEPRAIKAILDGHCVTDEPTPPVYCIGPLIALTIGLAVMMEAQTEQLKEIAVGLERSGQRFLWVESEDGFVRAEEVEKRVCDLMDSEEGNSVRMQVLKMKAAAEAAMSEGGSSRVALSKLVESWTQG
ncbi:hypothetical protein C3L33_03276, partial [Rhododendron williamsianum]